MPEKAQAKPIARGCSPLAASLRAIVLLCSCWAAGCGGGAGEGGSGKHQADGGSSRVDVGEQPDGGDASGPGCFPTNGGVERCDGLDNDCNGLLDDVPPGDPQLLDDPLNCGACRQRCEFPHAYGLCEEGRCVLGPCEEGYADMIPALPGEPEDGCETRCEAEHYQAREVCDGRDNDCDGEVDEGFDLDGDEDNCGRCGHRCELPGVVDGGDCHLGECLVTTCSPGFFDLDGEPANGCEYACVPRDGGQETCNGLDDDCDGATDEPAELAPSGIVCLGAGVCQGVRPACGGLAGWYCPYPEDLVEFPEEQTCDGLDDDCDGETDETFPQKGEPCLSGEGICRGEGVWECTPDGRALRCTGVERPDLAAPELCNGLDDDCDGEVDNEVIDLSWVQVADLRIFTFEASRPDAGPDSAGTLLGRACSKEGVLPWNEVSHEEAALACALGGWRLCTVEELQLACGGPAATRYPYGNDFRAGHCNGGVLDESAALAVTGAFPQCSSHFGAFDLSGNLKEWTKSTPVDAGGQEQAGVHLVVGGAFDSSLPESVGCFGAPVPRGDEFRFPNLGFRCCWKQNEQGDGG